MRTRKSLSVSFLIRRNRGKRIGKCPVLCRITINRKRIEFQTELLVYAEDWNEYMKNRESKKEQVRKLRPEVLRFEARVWKVYQELMQNEETPTAFKIRDRVLGISESSTEVKTIMEVANEYYKSKANSLGKGMKMVSLKKYETTKAHLEDFLDALQKDKNLTINSLDIKFFNQMKEYLLTVKGNGQNGMVGHMRRLKRMADFAVTMGYLENLSYRSFSEKIKSSAPVYLEMTELQRIQSRKFYPQRLEDVKNLFLFSCYTGLAFIDAQNLMRDRIMIGCDGNKWIFTRRQKTGTEVNVPLLKQALEILEIYEKDERLISRNQLLPKLSNQKMNAYLKEIADICGINKRLTTHCARHSFGSTICAANGMPIETTQDLLGHDKIQTTRHYYRISKVRIATDMNELERKLSQQKESSQNNQYNSGQENRAI